MSKGRRIKFLTGSPFEPGEPIQFNFEGHSIEGFSREPVAMALLASGVPIFGRSIKYHRPRGPFCLRGHCSGCLMRVDGVPNVRTCETLCRSGMNVERQIGWPNSGFDIFRSIDWAAPERMDHHGMFTSASSFNRLAGRMVRKFSGFGAPPSADIPEPKPITRLDCEALVVGGGAAGLAAATMLADYGHAVTLVESDTILGGRTLDGASSLPNQNGNPRRGWDLWREWQQELSKRSGIEVHLGSSAVAVYPGETLEVIVCSPNSTLQILCKRLVICTGTYETTPLFSNNDLPGIFGMRALDRLVCRYGVTPGEPLVLVGDSDQTINLASLLCDLGIALAAVVVNRKEGEWTEHLRGKNIPLIQNRQVTRARGSRFVQRLELSQLDRRDPDMVVDCRACAVEGLESPAYELAHHAGCRVGFNSRNGYMVVVSPEGHTSHSQVFAAGHCAGATSLTGASEQGKRAGLACALSIRENPKASKHLSRLLESSLGKGP